MGENEAAAERYRAPALEKGLDILELLASERRGLSMSEIAERLERSKNEIFRMIQVLERRDYIERLEASDKYIVTSKLIDIAMEQPHVRDLTDAALPVMRALAENAEQSCHLALPSRDQFVIMARVESPGGVGFAVRVGYRQPIIVATSGLVLFAFQDANGRQRWMQHFRGQFGRGERARFLEDAKNVRARGYARRPSADVTGIIDISVPVRSGDVAIAALTIPYLVRKDCSTSEKDAIRMLLEAADEISRRFAYA